MNNHQQSYAYKIYPDALPSTYFPQTFTPGKDIKEDHVQDMDISTANQRQRRKEQNRVAQRAFRERKERYVKELELKIKAMEKDHAEDTSELRKENEVLRSSMKQMESEMYTLRGAALAFELSMRKLREAGIEVPDIQQHTMVHQSGPERLDTRGADQPLSPRVDEFAESTAKRFEHLPDPITRTNAKLIPYSKVWELLSEHPRFDEFDLEELCEELKTKAKCSGTGPVIEEAELNNVLWRMDKGHITSI
ncbi:hypothetical protein DFQ30_005194 [Apophysomyces sp. BC1015]|nr:hypothetical protein DFQ30_005194 [Apophysomyces sp. BC1015]